MTRRLRFAAVLAGLLTLVLSAAEGLAQSHPAASAAQTLAVAGDVKTPMTLTMADLKALPRTLVETRENFRTVAYEGVLVSELLQRAGAPTGADLRGNAVASYVVASATDGYQVVFSLAELDPGFNSSEVIVADTVNGRPLFDYQGPFRIVAPKDRRGARSIRMLEKIELVRLRK